MDSFSDEWAERVITESRRIERLKQGRALTEEEVRVLEAAGFLRRLAPYLFENEESPARNTSTH